MHIPKHIKIGILPLLALPLMGESCTEEKVISLAVGLDTTAEFLAEGQVNVHDDTDTIDIRNDVDIPGALDDNDIDPADVQSIQVSRIYYRVTVPDPETTRTIDDGTVTIQLGSATPVDVITGFSGSAGAATDWIEVTSDVNPDAITLLNDFMAEYLNELQGDGPPVADTVFTYHVTGTSNPQEVPSNFQWEIKFSFSAKANETVEVPNF
jgi:hypothetical protein